MRIAFLLHEVKHLAEQDYATSTTLHLVAAALRGGHRTHLLTGRALTALDARRYALALRVTGAPDSPPEQWFSALPTQEEILDLFELDCLVLRLPPPLDRQLFGLLEALSGRVLLVNEPRGILVHQEKSHILPYAAAGLAPRTLVSRDRDEIVRFIAQDLEGPDFILKPLVGKMGEGVLRLRRSGDHNLLALLDHYIGTHTKKWTDHVLVQQALDATEGDVRVLVLEGRPIGAMRRVPAAGDHRANIHAGATHHRHRLDESEIDLIRAVAPDLRRHGLFLAGLDLLGGKLLEINACSPGGIPRINGLDGVRLEETVLEAVVRTVQGVPPRLPSSNGAERDPSERSSS